MFHVRPYEESNVLSTGFSTYNAWWNAIGKEAGIPYDPIDSERRHNYDKNFPVRVGGVSSKISSVLPIFALGALGGAIGWFFYKKTGIVVGTLIGSIIGSFAKVDEPGDTFSTVNGRSYLVHIPENSSGKYLVYFHGNGAKIDNLWDTIAALDKADEPRIIIIPQLDPKGYISKDDLVGILDSLKVDNVDVLAHSGGFVAAAMLLNSGKTVDNVGLLDALYGNLDDFDRFAKSSSSHTLVDIYGPTTKELSMQLMSYLAGRDNATFKESQVGHGYVPIEYGASVLNSFR